MAQRFNLGNNSTPYSQQDMTIFHYGDTIPGYSSFSYQPKVWYDQSRSIDGNTDIFNELGVAMSLILGGSEDDLMTMEEILEETCKYLNLHIIQLGYDFYMFDWQLSKSENSVTWLNIFKPTETKQSTYSMLYVTKDDYADDGTQLSMADVFNQIQVTDKVEKFEDVILSPFDDANLENICMPQHYFRELYATGQGSRARDAFKTLLNGGVGTTYGDGDSGYTRDWWFNVKGSKYWKFTLNGVDNYTHIPVDGSGNKYRQHEFAKWVDETPWASGIFAFGHGDEINNKNQQNIENITEFKDTIVINVAGNGQDENSPEYTVIYDPYNGMPIGTQPRVIYPSENDIKNSGMKIEYVNANDGQYSSSDSSIVNYLVFSGNIHLSIATGRSGSLSFAGYENDAYNIHTRYANEGRSGYHYVDDTVFKRKQNTYQNIKDMVNNNMNWSGRCVGSDSNEDGRYYTDLFYTKNYPSDADVQAPTINMLTPHETNQGNISKRFNYDLSSKTSYYAQNGGYDVIPYVDILACTLRIGNKYCVESVVLGHKVFDWLTEDELRAQNRYLQLANGEVILDAFIYLAIDINDGEYLVGQTHPLYNNVSTDMGIDKQGIAIPLPANKHLSGELHFSIVGIVNNVWDNGVRRHSTWFRHTEYSQNYISIFPHVDKIFIEKFSCEFVSDNGKALVNPDADIVYLSDETKKYLKRSEHDFIFNSGLSSSEAAAMGVAPITSKSTVVKVNSGDALINYTNNITNEFDKPERFYVDSYYREFCEPRLIVDTTLIDHNDFEHLDSVQFRKFTFPYIEDKTFFVVKTERDLKNESIALTLKEINS